MLKNLKAAPGCIITRIEGTWQEKIGSIYLPSGPSMSFETGGGTGSNSKYAKITISGEVVSAPAHAGWDHVYQPPIHLRGKNHIFASVRTGDHPVQIHRGDTAIWHYLSLEQLHNYLGFEDGWHYWRIEYRNLMGFKRNNKICGVNGRSFIKRLDRDEVISELAGYQLDIRYDIRTGIIKDVAKVQAHNVGRIVDPGHVLGPDTRRTIKEGDKVFYSKLGRFNHVIDGKDLDACYQWDIFAVVDGEEYFPVGSWLLLQVDKDFYNGPLDLHKDLHGNKFEIGKPRSGTIMRQGELCDQELVGKGDVVEFDPRHGKITYLDSGQVMVREDHILAIYA